MPLSIEAYPHILDAVVRAADPATLLVLRRVSRAAQAAADARLHAHLRHTIATDATATVPLSLPVDLFRDAAAVRALRVLDLHLGAYRDPNEIDVDVWDGGSAGSLGDEEGDGAEEGEDDGDGGEDEYEWKEETAAVLPRAPGLEYCVLYGQHASVFRHVLQNRHVPTVVAPVRGADFASDWLAVPKAQAGCYVPTHRVWVPTRAAPHAGALKLQLFREKPLHVAVVILPAPTQGRRPEEGQDQGQGYQGYTGPSAEDGGAEPEPDTEPDSDARRRPLFYASLVDIAAADTADPADPADPAPFADADADPYPDPPDAPATFTIVGLEAWDAAHPRADGRSWAAAFEADFAAAATAAAAGAAGASPAALHRQLGRVGFCSLADWRESITDEEWDIVSGVQLD